MITEWTVFTVDNYGKLNGRNWSVKFRGTEEEVKDFCKKFNDTLIEVSNNYCVFVDYKEEKKKDELQSDRNIG